jgi:hypothetical protein
VPGQKLKKEGGRAEGKELAESKNSLAFLSGFPRTRKAKEFNHGKV